MASIGNFGWIVKIGGSAVSDVSPLDQDGKGDFKFSDRKAAMEDARTNSWIVKSVGSSVSLFPIALGGWTFSPFFFLL